MPGGEACSQPLPGIKTGFSGHSPSEGSLGERDSAGRQLPLVGEEKKREGKKKSKKKKAMLWAVQPGCGPRCAAQLEPGANPGSGCPRRGLIT